MLRLLIAILFCCAAAARADTHPATTASLSDVQAAIALASNGDTVTIPPQTVTWSSTLNIVKAINLIGSGTNSTIINNSAGCAIHWQPSQDLPIRLSGIRLNSGLPGQNTYNIIINGTEKAFRIDHCYFTGGDKGLVFNAGYGPGTVATGPIYGVVDHCTFINCSRAMFVMDHETGDSGYGNQFGATEWARPILPGTTNMVVVEDCWFEHTSSFNANGVGDTTSIYGQGGGKRCFRNNTFKGMCGYIDMHGDDPDYSVNYYEVYSNLFLYGTYDGGSGCNGSIANQRGGVTIYHHNQFPTQMPAIQYCKYWPTDVHTVTSTYIWGNTMGADANQAHIYLPSDCGHGANTEANIIQNRDFFLHEPQSGQTFFPYTPLVYPHPLVSGSGSTDTNPPSITAQPVGFTNSTFSLTVGAVGTAPLLYQWQRSATNLSGATASSFTKANPTSDDSGDYRVCITNAYGWATSSIATVLITNTPPSITTQPVGTTNLSFSLFVVAAGTPPLAYQWRRSATNLAGATLSSYAKTPTNMDDTGAYSVVVTNSVGSITSATVNVLITNGAPQIIVQPQGFTNVTFNLSVTAVGATPLSYQWQRSDTNLASATASIYTKAVPSTNDSGAYRVIVTNTWGGVTSQTATVWVTNGAPSILVQPQGQTNVTISLSVSAVGLPTIYYQWRRYSTNLAGATQAVYTRAAPATNESGPYTVYITNALGTITSSVATVLVTNGAPSILVQPVGTTNESSFALSVTAVGVLPLAYQWRLYGTNLSGATASAYSKNPAISTDSGPYTVRISNGYGVVTSSTATILITNLVPIVTVQPVGFTNVTFTPLTTTAVGVGTLAYQWRLYGTNLTGASLTSYTKSSPTTNDSGPYTAVITNTYGSVTSSAATVLITNDTHVYIWPLGDSLTRGGPSSTPGAVAGGYRLTLFQLLTNSGVNAWFVGNVNDNPSTSLPCNQHDGYGGYEIYGSDNSGGLGADVVPFVVALEHTPAYVLLLVGINDFRHNNDTAHATNRLAALITQIATNLPATTKIMVADMNPWVNLGNTNTAMETYYNPFIPGVVTNFQSNGTNVFLSDMRGLISTNDLLTDNTHPNENGYKIIATNWFLSMTSSNPPPAPPVNFRVLYGPFLITNKAVGRFITTP